MQKTTDHLHEMQNADESNARRRSPTVSPGTFKHCNLGQIHAPRYKAMEPEYIYKKTKSDHEWSSLVKATPWFT
jgi:hypothetical protein